jgi:hypothetical protein
VIVPLDLNPPIMTAVSWIDTPTGTEVTVAPVESLTTVVSVGEVLVTVNGSQAPEAGWLFVSPEYVALNEYDPVEFR